LPLPADDLAADLYELTENICAEKGLHAYEVSNYAKPVAECRHNLTYWNYGEYVGIGPGAHGRIIIDCNRYATTQWRTPEKWLRATDRNESMVELASLEQEEERVMMGLRTIHGITWNQPIGPRLKALINEDFLKLNGTNLKATSKGRLALQSVLGYLLTDS
jgi:oxygen-independent coproporphyrinogen-3 oxidase